MSFFSTSAKTIDRASAAHERVTYAALHAEAVKQRARLSLWRAAAFLMFSAEIALYLAAAYALGALPHLLLR
jgi:hypothetical protein